MNILIIEKFGVIGFVNMFFGKCEWGCESLLYNEILRRGFLDRRMVKIIDCICYILYLIF